MRPRVPITLLGLGTGLPEHCADETQIAYFLTRVLEASVPEAERSRRRAFLERILRGSGIRRRFSVLPDYVEEDPARFRFYPPNWRLEPFPTTEQRMKVYEETSVPLCERTARNALADAGVEAGDVSHLVITTCTGFFAPGPDVLLSRRLGLRSTVERSIVGFMGCYAGFNGMRTAAQILGSDPDAVVLQISIELCTLHIQRRDEADFHVANCIFSDGCAAAVFGSEERRGKGRARLLGTYSAVQPETLDAMTWRIGDTGFEMRLSIEIPSLLRDAIEPFVGTLLDEAGVGRDEVGGWAIHPGGRRIVEQIGEALRLGEDDLRASLTVLREFGNMSSATIFFVLQELLRQRPAAGPIVALGFGPGLTLEGAVLAAEA